MKAKREAFLAMIKLDTFLRLQGITKKELLESLKYSGALTYCNWSRGSMPHEATRDAIDKVTNGFVSRKEWYKVSIDELVITTKSSNTNNINNINN